MTALTVTSTASMEETLLGHLVPAPALPATLASVVQTVLPALQAIVDHLLMFALLILVKPHQTLLMMGLTVTSTASMGGTLVGLQALAPAQVVALGLWAIVVSSQYIMWLIWTGYSTRSVIECKAVLTLATPSWQTVTLRF
jgi:hypothetical protein